METCRPPRDRRRRADPDRGAAAPPHKPARPNRAWIWYTPLRWSSRSTRIQTRNPSWTFSVGLGVKSESQRLWSYLHM